jgi:hypothetical protein
MKIPLLIVLLLLSASHAFSNELIGDWVEVDTGLGMNIKEKGVIILNSRGENPISGTWSTPTENKMKVEYTVNGKKTGGIIPYLFRGSFLVFPSQNGPGDREEVYKRSPKKTEVELVRI